MPEPLPAAEQRFVRRALAFRAFLRDPALPGLVLMAAVSLGGFIALIFGWYGAAGTAYVPLQLPLVVSGGIGGLALIGVGVALFNVQMARRDAANEKRITDDLLDEVADLVTLAPKIRKRCRKR